MWMLIWSCCFCFYFSLFLFIDYACYCPYPGDDDSFGNCSCQSKNEQSYWRGEYLLVAAFFKFGTHFVLDEALEHNPHPSILVSWTFLSVWTFFSQLTNGLIFHQYVIDESPIFGLYPTTCTTKRPCQTMWPMPLHTSTWPCRCMRTQSVFSIICTSTSREPLTVYIHQKVMLKILIFDCVVGRCWCCYWHGVVCIFPQGKFFFAVNMMAIIIVVMCHKRVC